jgi:hypothetical protein
MKFLRILLIQFIKLFFVESDKKVRWFVPDNGNPVVKVLATFIKPLITQEKGVLMEQCTDKCSQLCIYLN